MEAQMRAVILLFTSVILCACATDHAEPEQPIQSDLVSGAVVTDIILIASDSGQNALPAGPTGYTYAGNWDVGGGGSLGSSGTTGKFMMVMYVRYESKAVTNSCLESVILDATNDDSTPASYMPGFVRRGYWDVDNGGSVGTFQTNGTFMTGLYTKTGSVADQKCLVDVVLTASSASTSSCPGGYSCVGWWDVDNGGAQGTFQTHGSFMMSLSILSE